MTEILNDTLWSKLDALHKRFKELEQGLSDDQVIGTPVYNKILGEHARLSKLMQPYLMAVQAKEDLEGAKELLEDPEMAEEAQAEIADQEQVITEQSEHILELLAQADSASDRPAILEIRAGAGGDEASIFAGDLARMYEMFAQQKGWRFETLTISPAEMGGFKEVTFVVRGEGAYGLLRFESGGHRVQRVPVTESQGRVHTSAATVAVMPEVEEVDVDIRSDDLRIDVFRASGAGGQHVNKTESAVRITHLPTNTVVSCQDEKSQAANKERAMKILRARVYEAERERAAAERSAERKEQVGSGDRSDRIRTYNYPQNRISDHRINYTAYNLDKFMNGHLEELQQAIIDHNKATVLDAWDGSF